MQEYCQTGGGNSAIPWCDEQLTDFHVRIENFSKRINGILESKSDDVDTEAVRLSLEMRKFAIEKYRVFFKIWLQYDTFTIYLAISVAFWLLIHFLLTGVLSSTVKFMPITPVTLVILYLGYCTGIDKWYFDKLCIVTITVICFLSIEIDLTLACRYLRHE